jgi:hypothetical protein
MPSTEAALSASCVKIINARGGYARKNHGDSRVRKGRPDIEGCYRGHHLGLEVKLPGKENNVTPLQKKELDAIRAAGGIARVVSSTTHVRLLLDNIDKKYQKQHGRGAG